VDDYETWKRGGVMSTLNAFDIGDVRTTIMVIPALCFDEWNDGAVSEKHNTLRAGGKHSTGVLQNQIVRRLTPIECERLQGFLDNWTDGQADSHRYKQMGNAVTVNVIEWIGNKL